MYKIMYRVLTEEPEKFAFWGHRDEQDIFHPFEYETEDEVKEAAKALVQRIGAGDIRIVLDEDYYLKIIMGIRPEPIANLFDVQLSGSTEVSFEPDSFENVIAGSTLVSTMTFIAPVAQFHMIVDGEETPMGVLDWIQYDVIDEYSGILTLKDIQQDHTIIIVIDAFADEITL